MFLPGQPALKVRLAASSKRDGNEWAWVVNAAQQPRLCGISARARSWLCGMSARARSRVALRKILVQFPELVVYAAL